MYELQFKIIQLIILLDFMEYKCSYKNCFILSSQLYQSNELEYKI